MPSIVNINICCSFKERNSSHTHKQIFAYAHTGLCKIYVYWFYLNRKPKYANIWSVLECEAIRMCIYSHNGVYIFDYCLKFSIYCLRFLISNFHCIKMEILYLRCILKGKSEIPFSTRRNIWYPAPVKLSFIIVYKALDREVDTTYT